MNKTTNTSVNNNEAPVLRDARIPRDLTDWSGDFELVRMALEAIERANINLPGNFKTPNATYRAPMLLTLLTTAYARGIYGSQEIEAAIAANKSLQYICSGARPNATVIRQFRKQNLLLLQATLTELLKEAWNVQYPARRTAGAESYYQTAMERWTPTAASPIFAAEAANRLRMAIMADSLVRDE
jgi:hypothetical protein